MIPVEEIGLQVSEIASEALRIRKDTEEMKRSRRREMVMMKIRTTSILVTLIAIIAIIVIYREPILRVFGAIVHW